jgi:hypothetical protein
MTQMDGVHEWMRVKGIGAKLKTEVSDFFALKYNDRKVFDEHQMIEELHPSPLAKQLVREVYSDSGLMGFWRGTLPSLLMVSNPAIQYMLFEWLRTQRSRLAQYRSTLPSPGQVFVMGALAKMGATVVRVLPSRVCGELVGSHTGIALVTRKSSR